METHDANGIEERWGRFKEVYDESANKVPGEKRRVKNDWISGKTSRSIGRLKRDEN